MRASSSPILYSPSSYPLENLTRTPYVQSNYVQSPTCDLKGSGIAISASFVKSSLRLFPSMSGSILIMVTLARPRFDAPTK